jgi:hypothetical protein
MISFIMEQIIRLNNWLIYYYDYKWRDIVRLFLGYIYWLLNRILLIILLWIR